jgi:hypothetical protein
MKKMIVFLLAVTLLGTTLIGCSPKKTLIETLDDGFTDFLDAENFVHSSSQISFREQVEQYTYNGQPLKDVLQVIYHDGLTGGECSGKGEHFGYTNNYERKLFSRKVNYTNSFYTQVALDNLTLPYGIDFDDTITEVFEKMDVTLDAEQDFVADDEKKDATIMTLYEEDGRTLVLRNYLQDKSTKKHTYNFVLTYQETYRSTRSNGKKTNVTRTVTLSFGTDDVLDEMNVSVKENYKK